MNLNSIASEFLDPGFPGYEETTVNDAPVEGIFTRDYIDAGGVASSYPIFITLVNALAEGDSITLSEGSFTVEQVERDGAGMQSNILREL